MFMFRLFFRRSIAAFEARVGFLEKKVGELEKTEASLKASVSELYPKIKEVTDILGIIVGYDGNRDWWDDMAFLSNNPKANEWAAHIRHSKYEQEKEANKKFARNNPAICMKQSYHGACSGCTTPMENGIGVCLGCVNAHDWQSGLPNLFSKNPTVYTK